MNVSQGVRFLGASLLAASVGCGGRVVVDLPSGEGGAGGAGNGSGTGGASQGTTIGVVASGVSSGSTGGGFCDGVGDCGACAQCALGDSCAPQWNECMNTSECAALWICISGCASKVECEDDCAATFPGGIKLYNAVAACVVCDACAGDCAQMSEPCPP